MANSKVQITAVVTVVAYGDTSEDAQRHLADAQRRLAQSTGVVAYGGHVILDDDGNPLYNANNTPWQGGPALSIQATGGTAANRIAALNDLEEQVSSVNIPGVLEDNDYGSVYLDIDADGGWNPDDGQPVDPDKAPTRIWP